MGQIVPIGSVGVTLWRMSEYDFVVRMQDRDIGRAVTQRETTPATKGRAGASKSGNENTGQRLKLGVEEE